MQSVLQLNLNITSSCTWLFYNIVETIFMTIIHTMMQNLQALSMLLFEVKCDDHLEIKMLIVRLLQKSVSISQFRQCIRLSVSLISQYHCKNHHWQVNQHLIFTSGDLNLHCHKVEWMLLCCLSLSWWLSCSAEDEKFEWWKHCCSWSQQIFKNVQEEDINEEGEVWDGHWMYVIPYLTSSYQYACAVGNTRTFPSSIPVIYENKIPHW